MPTDATEPTIRALLAALLTEVRAVHATVRGLRRADEAPGALEETACTLPPRSLAVPPDPFFDLDQDEAA